MDITRDQPTSENQDPIISRDPWPAKPIEEYTCIDSGDWGYLSIHASLKAIFDSNTRPSDEEILARWGKRLATAKSKPQAAL